MGTHTQMTYTKIRNADTFLHILLMGIIDQGKHALHSPKLY